MHVCTIGGCNNKYRCKGFCEMHYTRYRVHGDPLKTLHHPNQKCSINNCKNKHKAKGLCNNHYEKQRHENNLEESRNKRYLLIKKWRKNNPEKYKNINDRYCIKNKEKISKRGKNRYKRKRQEILGKTRKYRKENPEKVLETNKKYLEKLSDSFDMTSIEYDYARQVWSKTIKKLDNNMCKLCDSRENLNAHHIMPKALFPELSLDLDNGVTLCNKCHSDVHGFGIY